MKLRKLFAALAASAVAVSAMSVAAFAADATGEDGLAVIAYAGGDWTAQYWANGETYASEMNSAVITGDGTYTVSVKAVATVVDEDTGEDVNVEGTSDLAFAALQVVNGENLFPGMVITIDSVKFDGNEVALKGTPYTSSDEGITTRVNLFNEWVSKLPDDARTVDGLAADATATAVDRAVGPWTVMEVTFTVTGTSGAAAEEAPVEEPAEAPATTEAPAEEPAEAPATTGDVDVATDSTKGSPDTGIADVAAVAGLAVLAGGAFIVAKKRK